MAGAEATEATPDGGGEEKDVVVVAGFLATGVASLTWVDVESSSALRFVAVLLLVEAMHFDILCTGNGRDNGVRYSWVRRRPSASKEVSPDTIHGERGAISLEI